MRKLHCPVSGIARGSSLTRAPYKNAGKYHHRRELLFSPEWGRRPEPRVSRNAIPQGSTLMWEKDAARAWPHKESAKAEVMYRDNEQRYLTPALKARDPGIRNYLMNQLDGTGRSGIGLFNVRWSPTLLSHNALSETDIDRLPPGIPKHLVAVLNESHNDILCHMLRHSIPRQK